jgi:tRNA U34 5-carboxymethylaminomethyl modifying GTPase MnmE/TrmE
VEAADLVLAVYDSSQPPPPQEPFWRRLISRANVLVVSNKLDLTVPRAPGAVAAPFAATSSGAEGSSLLAQPRHADSGISVSTGAGLDELRREMLRRLGVPADLLADLAAAFTPRQAALLKRAAAAEDPVTAAGLLWQLLVGD